MGLALVTGGSGLVGSHMVQRLLSENVRVRVMVRPTTDLAHLHKLPVEIHVVENGDDWMARLLQDVSWVFHAAGYLRASSSFSELGEREKYERNIVQLTRSLVLASAHSGVKRFVYTSSVSVYGIGAECPIGEDAPLNPCSEYGKAKVEAETIVRSATTSDMAVTIIRPAIIYGPGDRHCTPSALQLNALPVLLLPNSGKYLLDLVHVSDVVELMWRASQSPRKGTQVYNAGSGTAIPLSALFQALRSVTEKGPLAVSIPPKVLRLIAPLVQIYLRAFAPDLQELMSTLGVAYMSRDLYFDVERARNELNFIPQMDFQTGIRQTLLLSREGANANYASEHA